MTEFQLQQTMPIGAVAPSMGLVLEAINPATGNPVTGVAISNAIITIVRGGTFDPLPVPEPLLSFEPE